jgi:CDP-glucose 4,6-dehydratase
VELRQGAVEGLVNASFWSGRRVFVTGHTGFKGAWLSLWLTRMGARVTGYALAPDTQPNLFHDARVAAGIEHLEGDVRELAVVRQALAASGAEVVLHLAAQSLVRRGYREPVQTYATNVLGTVNVLEAARHSPTVGAVVVVTSDKCYDDHQRDRGYREGDQLGGRDPYANSKACAELVTQAYRDSYFTADGPQVATARAGNVVGGGDWSEDRLVPDVYRALLAGRPVRLRSPKAVRPWQHVLESLSGYLVLAQRLMTEGGASLAAAWNFGPEDADTRTVQEVVERLVICWDPPGRWEPDPREHPHETHWLRLDSSQARERLGWRPRLSLSETLAWIDEWYAASRSGTDLRAVTLAQLDRYARLACTQ